MRTLTHALLGAVLATAVAAQDLSKPQASLQKATENLRNARLHASAMHDLIHAEGDGARATLAAFLAARATKDPAAAIYAKALADLGPATSHILEALVENLGPTAEPLRSHLLRALSNGSLFATPEQGDAIRTGVKVWADAGKLYSPSADEPTFAWYEYVRLVRRLSLASRGDSGAAITQAMANLRKQRGDVPIFGGQPVKDKYPHCAIESFGAHGQRELLEGIAELAIACPDVTAAVLDELHAYLRLSPPREPRMRTEHCAGIGENAPNKLPGTKWPTKWRYDDWHFACARAVLLRSQDAKARELALRHLLYASNVSLRLRALEDLRQWPKPWNAFSDDLKQCLATKHRIIVRAALLTIGQAPELVAAAKPELERLVKDKDRELAAMAKRALARHN